MYQQLIEHVKEQLSSSLSTCNSLNQRVIGFLTHKNLKSQTFDFEVISDHDPIQRWESWRLLLKATLLFYCEGKLESKIAYLKEKWYELKKQHSFEGFQIQNLYAKIIAHFLNIKDTTTLTVTQEKSGFCPLYMQSHWQLLKVPFIDQHAEFATLLLLLGKLTHNPALMNQGYKAALWHTKNLDLSFIPYRGFLSNHLYCDYRGVVLKQATLFHLASLALEDKEMAYLAKSHYSFLLKSQPYQLKEISLDTLLMWTFIDKLFQNQLTPDTVRLPNEVFEEKVPLAGIRGERGCILCSLMGNNSSMGTLIYEDLQVAAFGPQLENLGEGHSFGFIGINDKDESFELQKKPNSFTLKGIVGLPFFKKNLSQLKIWQHARSWLDVKLNYEKECLTVSIKPLRLKQKTYFVFYVIADQCLIKGEKKILYQSLEQFQGKACSVSFLNKTKMMILEPALTEGEMKIIPLEGEKSFWGANYLIAYHLNNKYSTFEWKISCNKR